ncbi:unnamed protein product, partial [Symbiodinium necroappetens]
TYVKPDFIGFTTYSDLRNLLNTLTLMLTDSKMAFNRNKQAKESLLKGLAVVDPANLKEMEMKHKRKILQMKTILDNKLDTKQFKEKFVDSFSRPLFTIKKFEGNRTIRMLFNLNYLVIEFSSKKETKTLIYLAKDFEMSNTMKMELLTCIKMRDFMTMTSEAAFEFEDYNMLELASDCYLMRKDSKIKFKAAFKMERGRLIVILKVEVEERDKSRLFLEVMRETWDFNKNYLDKELMFSNNSLGPSFVSFNLMSFRDFINHVTKRYIIMMKGVSGKIANLLKKLFTMETKEEVVQVSDSSFKKMDFTDKIESVMEPDSKPMVNTNLLFADLPILSKEVEEEEEDNEMALEEMSVDSDLKEMLSSVALEPASNLTKFSFTNLHREIMEIVKKSVHIARLKEVIFKFQNILTLFDKDKEMSYSILVNILRDHNYNTEAIWFIIETIETNDLNMLDAEMFKKVLKDSRSETVDSELAKLVSSKMGPLLA